MVSLYGDSEESLHPPPGSLDDVDVLVIDLQESYRGKFHEEARTVRGTSRLLSAAGTLGVPVMLNEQYPKGLGGTVPELAERLDHTGQAAGGYLIALDAIGAGHGETVLILDEGNGARQILENETAPVRSLVVGIVDAVALEAG